MWGDTQVPEREPCKDPRGMFPRKRLTYFQLSEITYHAFQITSLALNHYKLPVLIKEAMFLYCSSKHEHSLQVIG